MEGTLWQASLTAKSKSWNDQENETFDRKAMIDWSKFNLAKQAFQTCENDGEEGLTWDEVDSCEVLY